MDGLFLAAARSGSHNHHDSQHVSVAARPIADSQQLISDTRRSGWTTVHSVRQALSARCAIGSVAQWARCEEESVMRESFVTMTIT